MNHDLELLSRYIQRLPGHASPCFPGLFEAAYTRNRIWLGEIPPTYNPYQERPVYELDARHVFLDLRFVGYSQRRND